MKAYWLVRDICMGPSQFGAYADLVHLAFQDFKHSEDTIAEQYRKSSSQRKGQKGTKKERKQERTGAESPQSKLVHSSGDESADSPETRGSPEKCDSPDASGLELVSL